MPKKVLAKIKCKYNKCKKLFQPRDTRQKFCKEWCKNHHFADIRTGKTRIKESTKSRKYKSIKLSNGLSVLDNVVGLYLTDKEKRKYDRKKKSYE